LSIPLLWLGIQIKLIFIQWIRSCTGWAKIRMQDFSHGLEIHSWAAASMGKVGCPLRVNLPEFGRDFHGLVDVDVEDAVSLGFGSVMIPPGAATACGGCHEYTVFDVLGIAMKVAAHHREQIPALEK
jgi:hypothetical protein